MNHGEGGLVLVRSFGSCRHVLLNVTLMQGSLGGGKTENLKVAAMPVRVSLFNVYC